MTWEAQHGCIGKRVFLSKREAKVANETLREKERRNGRQETHIYRCPKAWGGCGHFHLGHPGDHE